MSHSFTKSFFVLIFVLIRIVVFSQASVNESVIDELAKVQSGTCLIIFDGAYTCTGTLLNNTSLDGRPVILTASHCLDDPDQVESIVIILGRQKLVKNSTINAFEWRSNFGAQLLSNSKTTDHLLLELNETLPDELMPVFLGWSRVPTFVTTSSVVHHPTFDFKQFAHSRKRASFGTFIGISGSQTNGHWKVPSWTLGRTVEGSSGAALLNEQLQVLGGLSGSTFSAGDTSDYFYRFDIAWEQGGFHEILDVTNTNQQTLEQVSYTELKDLHKISNFVFSDSLSSTIRLNKNDPVTERFEQVESGIIKGIYLSVEEINADLLNSMRINILEASEIVYSEEINLFTLDENIENYIPFLSDVRVQGSISIQLQLDALDDDEWVSFPSVWVSDEQRMLHSILVQDVMIEEVGLGEEMDDIELFPNPASNFFVLNGEVEEVHVIDHYGKIVSPVFLKNFAGQTIVNLTGITPGSYYVKVYQTNETYKDYRIIIR